MASRIRATINLAFASLERAADENGMEACNSAHIAKEG